ncbi:hypothetical protein BKA63DRAFT_254688 [Paraphoma chrysanthemicola]|nr:hypothetical protein BKA63DRAFT_254688 [Paraphoma chrysanthemicola]
MIYSAGFVLALSVWFMARASPASSRIARMRLSELVQTSAPGTVAKSEYTMLKHYEASKLVSRHRLRLICKC